MPTFDYVVDTTPMANTVSSVSSHVRGTTAAVVAMESAVIKSEELASEKVCRNVTSGFHILIRSQVSQKAAGYFSQMSSKMVLLMEFAKTLATTKNRMTNDYQRLKREYLKIFRGLDKALENRIRQLDKNAMELGDARKNLVTNRIVKDAPSVLCYGKDTQDTAGLMFSARIKSKTEKALDSMAKSVFSSQMYKTQVDSVLDSKTVQEKQVECIPVIYTEEKSLISSESSVNNVYVSDIMEEFSKNNISSYVMENLSLFEIQNGSGKSGKIDLKSEVPAQEQSEIESEFMNLVSSASLDERVSSEIVALFKAAKGDGAGGETR